MQDGQPKLEFGILAICATQAFIVQYTEDSSQDIAQTYSVELTPLRLRYININEEARGIATSRKYGRNLLDDVVDGITLEQYFAESVGTGFTADELTARYNRALAFAKIFTAEDFKEVRQIYQEYRDMDYDKLETLTLKELEKQRDEAVKNISNFTNLGIIYGLPDSGYSLPDKVFDTLEGALNTLYYTWIHYWDKPNANEDEVKSIFRRGDIEWKSA